MQNGFYDTPFLERSLFRRQFLLGSSAFKPNSFWNNIHLPSNLILSVHSDLPFFIEQRNEKTIVLLGIAIDALNPDFDEEKILQNLFNNSDNITSLADNTSPLSGRWIIIYLDEKNKYIFNDPTGLRQIFYFFEENNFYCGSQPEIIKTQLKLEFNDDKDLRQFLLHPNLGNRESLWGGVSTIYKNCFLLLPNHYLDINNKKQVRFYFGKTAAKQTTELVAAAASKLLQNIVVSAVKRYNVRLALTGGLDSRTLLAAAKTYTGQIYFFVDRMGINSTRHSDVWVPKKISKKFDLKLDVQNSKDYLPGWFSSLLSHNVTGARFLPKTKSIYSKFLENSDRININGNVNMICKKEFIKRFRENWNKSTQLLTVEDLVFMFAYKDIPQYLVNEFNKWKDELQLYPNNLFDIFEIFLWEQRLSSWGALYPAEQDIASDEISPYNCRLLIETIMQAPNEVLETPGYPIFKELIKYMWPELLDFPINPKPKFTIEKTREKIKTFIPNPLYQKMRYYKRKFS